MVQRVYPETLRNRHRSTGRHGLVPDLEPALLAKRGGVIEPGFELEMSATRGDVYYTLDGSDPRLIGGKVSPVANKYTEPVRLDKTYVVKTRVLFEGEWSAIDELPFKVEGEKITETLKK